MLDSVKNKCGIPAAIATYDDQIQDYIEDALEDMRNSGVPYNICDRNTDGLAGAKYLVGGLCEKFHSLLAGDGSLERI